MDFMLKKQILIPLVFLILALVIFFFRDSVIVSPVIGFFQNAVANTRAQIFSTTAENESQLQEENRVLKEKLAGLELLERENIALRSQFEDNNSDDFELIPANIIGYKGRGLYETFLIGAGNDEQINAGMAVVVGNTLIGTIYKVNQNVSEVRTILHPEFSTIVKYPPTDARGIIRGFNSYLVLENVPITETLERDGILLTMGELNNEGIGIPSDLSVGKIDSVEKIETAPFQTAHVEPLVDYSQISTVFIIRIVN